MLVRYFWNVLISLDQLGNALLFGDPDETISSRCGKRRDRFGWRQLAWILDRIDPGHTSRAIERDEGKDGLL